LQGNDGLERHGWDSSRFGPHRLSAQFQFPIGQGVIGVPRSPTGRIDPS
jgi:hypothetical protein